VPFSADSFNELVFKIVLEVPEPLASVAPDVDPGLAVIVGRAMAREPDARYQTAQEFRESLAAWAAGTGATTLAGSAGAATVRVGSDELGTPLPSAQVAAQLSGQLSAQQAPRLGNTADTWSKTNRHADPTESAIPRNKSRVVPVVAGVVIVAALAAASFVFRPNPAGPEAASPAESVADRILAAESPPEKSPSAPRGEPAPEPDPVVSIAAPAPAEPEPPEPEAHAPNASEVKTAKPKLPATAKPKPQPATRSAPLAATKPQPAAPKPQEPQAAAPKPTEDGSKTSAGRPIRSSL
jgi:serine/threonine-protein kinase